MIKGFEEQTHDLTEMELEAGRRFYGIFGKGKKNAMSNKNIRAYLEKYHDIKISSARLRKIINFLRINQHVINLIADNNGYYIASNQQEINDYVTSLRQRANAINAVADSYD